MTPDFEKVFRSSSDLRLLLSVNLVVLAATDAFLRLVGQPAMAVEGKHLPEWLSQQQKDLFGYQPEAWLNSLTHVLQHKKMHTPPWFQARQTAADGIIHQTYWKLTNTPILDNTGNVQYIIHQLENVTELVKPIPSPQQSGSAYLYKQKYIDNAAPNAHSESTEKHKIWLKENFAHAPIGICLLSGENLVVEFINESLIQLLGTQASFLGKPLHELVPYLNINAINIVRSVRETQAPYAVKEYPITLDWQQNNQPYTRYFDMSLQVFHDEVMPGLIAFIYEVTELVHVKKQAEEDSGLFKHLVETTPQIVWTGTPEGGVSFFSQHWFSYSQMSYEESKDFGWMAAMHPEDVPQTLARSEYARGTGNIFETSYRLRRGRDGMYRWHLSRSVPVYNKQGKIILWVGTVTDIHDNKVFEEKLETKNKELEKINADLDNFVYTASHDLKAPIANMEGLTKALKRTVLDHLTPRERHLFSMTEASITKLKGTIEDLTEITRVQKDKGIATEIISISQGLAAVKEDIAMLLELSEAKILENLEIDTFRYIKSHIRSILYNLLSNAVKYRSPDRKLYIHISTYREDDYIVLSVSDNGLGMNRKQQALLFNMFKRFHPHVEGTGIGLYMIKRTVENKGGKIEVVSAENEGSTFKIYLKEQ